MNRVGLTGEAMSECITIVHEKSEGSQCHYLPARNEKQRDKSRVRGTELERVIADRGKLSSFLALHIYLEHLNNP